MVSLFRPRTSRVVDAPVLTVQVLIVVLLGVRSIVLFEAELVVVSDSHRDARTRIHLQPLAER